jgi:alpha-amylase
MKEICLCTQIQIPVILRNYRFFDINHNDDYYNDIGVDYQVNKTYINNLLPFFKTIKKLFIESGFRFKVAVSISGITLKLLQTFAPEAISDLADLGQKGCIGFLSEPWSHSLVAFSDINYMNVLADISARLERKKNWPNESLNPLLFRPSLKINNT